MYLKNKEIKDLLKLIKCNAFMHSITYNSVERAEFGLLGQIEDEEFYVYDANYIYDRTNSKITLKQLLLDDKIKIDISKINKINRIVRKYGLKLVITNAENQYAFIKIN
ncbi:MAG: hypothetical protein IJZ79_01345 [Bacilli bacterium]|nr:hypothetical protein [Bacilli bacterium]